MLDEILDLYEMTPTQAGMLFHSLNAPGTGAYVQQYWGHLDGALDEAAFRAAWQSVIARHDILRAQCHWQDLDHPALAIHATAQPDWVVLDLGDETALQDWLAQDRARGFDMVAWPLMRFALIRMGADRHVFVWSFHHLLLDGWCGALLVREMLAIYGGAQPGPAPRPFADYVDWCAAQDREAARDHWTRRLAGIEGPTPLGIDRVTGQAGMARHRAHLGCDLTAALADLARQERLTLATLIQGAWGLVLSRYAGQADVIFGTVLAGRPADLPGAETMIGLFLQTVPLRVVADDGVAPFPWLHSIQQAQRGAEAHGHLPLAEIQRCAGIPATTPLFDSLLIVETYPESIETAVHGGAGALRLTATGMYERTNFPLTIKVLPGDNIEIVLDADAARVPAAALPRLAGHLAQVLGALGADRLGAIDILTDAERDGLVQTGPTPPLPPMTLAQLLAVGRPDHPAVETPGGLRLSHAELMAQAGRIGATLAELGVGRGDIVAVCQDRTPDLVATLIGIWRCGAAYLPIDPSYPADRVAWIVEDSGAVLAVVDDLGAQALASQDGLGLLPVAECVFDLPLPDANDPDDLAYVLYTSGSTGRPKGVPIPHKALANFLASMCREPGISEDDRLLALTTIAFDIAGLELFGPLVAGGTLVLAETGAALDGAGVARMIADHRISVMQSTPAGWRVLRDAGWAGAPDLRMLSGGEALDSALAGDLMALGGPLWNLYGPTETTIWSGALRVLPQHLAGPKLPVGGALDNTTLSLRDAQGRSVPLGISGELWIGGDGLSPGYLHRPDLTADRFVTRDGARYYRTGDRMRLNADGTLDFLGRFDDQVKLRGYRIELGEIEKQLETHPAIAQAVAMVRGDGNAARLVAYLRVRGAAPTPAVARAHLAGVLPAYMIPSAWVQMDAFPLTPNGKIDRKSLPEPGAVRAAPAALDQRDAVVAGIWAEILGVPVGPGDDFFALGGHSLSAMRVIGEIRRHLGVDLTFRDLFEAPVLERFCARIAGQRVLPAVVAGAAPVLSAAQHRQWLLARLDPGNADYLLPLAVRLTGSLDVDRLQSALELLARRHAVLRSRYPSRRGVASVEILDDWRPELRVSAGDLDQAREEETAPFDLEAAPAWRARLVRLAEGDQVLLLTLHHILADEWSFGVMLRDLTQAYAGQAGDAPAVQYADFAAWQAALPLQDQRDYWQAQLDGAPSRTDLPADGPRSSGRVPVRLGEETARALEALSRRHGVTLFMTLLAAYALLLHRHSGQDQMLIGTPVSNRRLPEFQDLVGLFVNTVAIRMDLTAPDLSTLLAQTRETVLAAHQHQDLPFEQVIELMQPPRSEAHAPLVQVMFAMPDLPRGGDLVPGLSWRAMPGDRARARFALSLELSRVADGIEGHLDYAGQFAPETAEALARRFEVLLNGLAEGALADLPMLTGPDLALLAAQSGAEKVIVLGRDLALVPPGGRGQIALTGPGLIRGWQGEPARTAECFVPNPHVDPRNFDPDHACLFLTGEAARLTNDGQILREAAPDIPRLHGAARQIAKPQGGAVQGAVEATLAAIWADLLGVTPGSEDAFFDLGGDSIIAVQVASRAAEAGLAIEPRELFRHQTIAALALIAQPLAPAALPDLPALDIDLDDIAAMVSFGDE